MSDRNSIKKVSFIGSGNVASHLAAVLKSIGIEIVEVYSARPENAQKFADKFNCSLAKSIAGLNKNIDLLIISVPDSRIKEVSLQIAESEILVVHTSGITEMEVLDSRKRFGVFYPLQTFSKKRVVDMSEVPFCIEAHNKNDFDILMDLASKISKNVNEVNSSQRKVLHLTAVMVNNFSNHMYHLAHEILENNRLSFNLLLPLIHETALKVKDVHPAEAQTGPARRNDISTMQEHMKMLIDFPEYQEIYKLLSEQILKKYHE